MFTLFRKATILVIGVAAIILLPVNVAPIHSQDNTLVFDFSAYENNPVLPLGEQGAWDRASIFAPYTVEADGAYYLFYTASRSFGGQISIGVATSNDGYVFHRPTEFPIVPANDLIRNVGASVVTVQDGEWVMYFSALRETGVPTNAIWRAVATDPLSEWTIDPETPIITSQSNRWDHNIMPQGIVVADAEYRLYYIGFTKFFKEPQLGVATSLDGLTWTFADNPDTTDAAFLGSDPVLPKGEEGTWNAEGLTASNILQTEDGWELFYVGFDGDPLRPPSTTRDNLWLGYASSQDGIQWNDYGEPVIQTDQTGWPLINAIRIDDTYFIYYDYNFGQNGLGLMTGTISPP